MINNPLPRLARKRGAIFETHGLYMISLKIWENRGQYIISRGCHIWNPNRGKECPISGIAPIPPTEALNFAHTLGNPLS